MGRKVFEFEGYSTQSEMAVLRAAVKKVTNMVNAGLGTYMSKLLCELPQRLAAQRANPASDAATSSGTSATTAALP